MNPKLIINGAAGRMGKRIAAIAIQSGKIDVVCGTDIADHADIGKDIGTLAGEKKIGVALSSQPIADADVMIDFSLPCAADKSIDFCVENKIALFMATTGLDDSQLEKLEKASNVTPVILASNTSVGMNMLFGLVAQAAKILGEDYDIEITEAHHRFKKDSPSGSALSLAESIAKATDRPYPDCLVHGREGKDALREKGTIGMHAIRGGDIIGQHSVIMSTLGETITISHNAHSRDTFANGAVRAATWLAGKAAGKYSMSDVLGLS